MAGPTWVFIGGCWIGLLLFWLASASSTKRTVQRGGLLGYRVVAVLVAGGLILGGRLLNVRFGSLLWHTTTPLGVVSDVIVALGAAFAVWARITIGANWSAEVTLKEDHELIESGPYALVRHPIYTGLIVMALGTAINYGRAIGFVVFAALCGGLWWKWREEERIMSRQFPQAYADYKARVPAVIPFLL